MSATLQPVIPPRVIGICRRLRDAGHEAYVVGGSVRDLLLGRHQGDYDLTTSALPTDVLRVFRAVPTGIRFGTVTVLIGPDAEGDRQGFEVTTFRGEGCYHDGRHPDRVEFVGMVEEDLARRDFTVNAIAYDPLDQRLVDPCGGRADLDARLLRAVGDPVERFSEDGLRVMRAVRFAATLGFTVEESTLAAIPGALQVFARVSAERVRDELLKLLAAPRPSAGLELMSQTGLMAEVLPELLEGVDRRQNPFHSLDVYQHSLLTCDETKGDPILRLAALLHDIGKPRSAEPRAEEPDRYTFYKHEMIGTRMASAIACRLKLSNADRERITKLVRHHMFFYTDDWSGPTVRRFIRRIGHENIDDLFALRAGDVRGRDRGEDPESELAELRERIEQALAEDAALKVTDLSIGGADVMRILGVGPGPVIGKALHALLERVLDDPALNTPDKLEELLRGMEGKLEGEAGGEEPPP
jgi:tRNA nucleotidyltransferase (CCA-adding enzyme)